MRNLRYLSKEHQDMLLCYYVLGKIQAQMGISISKPVDRNPLKPVNRPGRTPGRTSDRRGVQLAELPQ